MASRVTWKVGDMVSLRLRDDLFTVGQMLADPIMRFYDVFNSDGNWDMLDLNSTSILFRAFVGRGVVKNLMTSKINWVGLNGFDSNDRFWIKPYTLTMDGYHYKGDRNSFPFLGGRLIDIGEQLDGDVTLVPTVKEDLALPNDRELIEKYELTNMWGYEDLSDRLCRYFDTGINRDDLKFEVFPGLWNDREQLRPLTRRLPVPYR